LRLGGFRGGKITTSIRKAGRAAVQARTRSPAARIWPVITQLQFARLNHLRGPSPPPAKTRRAAPRGRARGARGAGWREFAEIPASLTPRCNTSSKPGPSLVGGLFIWRQHD